MADKVELETDDVRQLESMGYAQELLRRMSGFSNFAISFSIICILAGGITSLQLGVSAVGGAAAGIIWPLGMLFSLIVAACMAQVASAFPTAGALYHWSSILGGRGWGWATAWFNLVGLMFVTAAVNVGAYGLFVNFVAPSFGVDPAGLGVEHQVAGVTLITISQALFNHFGIRLTTRLTDFSGYLIFAVTLLLCAVMLLGAPSLEFSRLFSFDNASGPSGGDVWPASGSLGRMTLLALMWPIYTITGFDASAHTSEETVQAAHNVPRGILRSVLVSGLFGWVMVSCFVLAAPNVADAARQGANVFPWLMQQVAPGAVGTLLWVGIVAANYLCGLACVTSTSRMTYAFARDGGLPLSSLLDRVSPRWKTPVPAIWLTATLSVASTLYAPAYSTLTTACVIFLYVSYVMPTSIGCFAYGRRWTKMGPFDLGPRWYRVLAVASVAGALLVVWIGVQPPNDKALTVLLVATLALLAAWWLGIRSRFRGPPQLSIARGDNAR
ncbi:MAG TPA: amino acid permease [Polyangiaceae bacterium]|nr:amino acid permease [Polyangiaceae bacterium]